MNETYINKEELRHDIIRYIPEIKNKIRSGDPELIRMMMKRLCHYVKVLKSYVKTSTSFLWSTVEYCPCDDVTFLETACDVLSKDLSLSLEPWF